MKDIVLYIVFLVYLFVFIGNLLHFVIVKKWIRLERESSLNVLQKSKRKIYLFIPLLNEQNIISDTFFHFLSIANKNANFRIVFITTEKEVRCGNKKLTKEILEELIQNNLLSDNIFLIHYPYKTGVMAHQLNYAIKQIKTTIEYEEDFWLGIYNADSRIASDTVNYINYKILNSDGSNKCFQQYSWYINPSKRKKSILSSASLWQSRWSLLFEMYRVIYQIKLNDLYAKKNNIHNKRIIRVLFDKMNYVIGHGLFITETTLSKVGGFPEDTINEDAYLGYILNNINIEIRPVPFLECADFAVTVRSYIKQQTVWFNGPLYAFQYRKLYMDNNIGKDVFTRSLSLKLFLHAVYWLCGPFILYIIPLFCIHNIRQLIVWLIIIFFETTCTHSIISNFLSKEGFPKEYIAKPSFLFCPLFYFIHCLGPLRGLLLKMIGRNNQEDKYKTKR